MTVVMKYRNVFMLVILAMTLLVGGAFTAVRSFASGPCTAYTIAYGDTLGTIAARFGTTYQSIAQRNGIANPNVIYAGQRICALGSNSTSGTATISYPTSNAAVGSTNPFAYPQCTWGADYLYHMYHGVYVPWYINANAAQWVARAYQYGWHVSSYPMVGDIVVFQGGVQGAYPYYGHVGVVTSVSGSRFIAESSNSGGWPFASYWYYIGYGVSFVHR